MYKAIFIAVMLYVAILSGGAAPKPEFRSAKLIGIGTDENVVKATAFRSALFTVQVADLIYMARGGRLRRGSGDLGKGLFVGDPVQVAVDGDHLIFMKPDGKEMKTIIMKRTRAQSQ